MGSKASDEDGTIEASSWKRIAGKLPGHLNVEPCTFHLNAGLDDEIKMCKITSK